MDYESLGMRIRRARKAAGMTQADLAEKLGISTSFLGHIERGTRKASLDTLVKMANELGVSLDSLAADSLVFLTAVCRSLRCARRSRRLRRTWMRL